jgi:hypothetical protein
MVVVTRPEPRRFAAGCSAAVVIRLAVDGKLGVDPASGMSIASRFARRNPPAVAAAVLAFASAAVTAFWLLGGTLGLDTVGGEVEEQARERSAAALAVLAVTLVAKLAAGGLALVLAGSPTSAKRSLITLGLVGGVGLALYGGVLVIAGALALAGVGDSAGRDEYALRWHVFFWDLWFFVWGVALGFGAMRARRQGSASVDAADGHWDLRPAHRRDAPPNRS